MEAATAVVAPLAASPTAPSAAPARRPDPLAGTDSRVRTLVSETMRDGKTTRDLIWNAHVAVHGERPAKDKVEERRTWQREFDADVTRYTRAAHLLTKDGKEAVPAGKTRNPGERTEGGGGRAPGRDDVKLFGKDLTRGQALTIVKILGYKWSPSLICDALREHGYTFAPPTTAEDDAMDVKLILAPVVVELTAEQKREAARVAAARATIAGLVEDGTIPAESAEAALTKLLARTAPRVAAPAAPAGNGAAPAAGATESAPHAPVEAPTSPSAPEPAPAPKGGKGSKGAAPPPKVQTKH